MNLSEELNKLAASMVEWDAPQSAIIIRRAATEIDRLSDMESFYKEEWSNAKEQLTSANEQNRVLREALEPFASGVSILPWGKIKALIGVETAKLLTGYNVAADNALSSTTPLEPMIGVKELEWLFERIKTTVGLFSSEELTRLQTLIEKTKQPL